MGAFALPGETADGWIPEEEQRVTLSADPGAEAELVDGAHELFGLRRGRTAIGTLLLLPVPLLVVVLRLLPVLLSLLLLPVLLLPVLLLLLPVLAPRPLACLSPALLTSPLPSVSVVDASNHVFLEGVSFNGFYCSHLAPAVGGATALAVHIDPCSCALRK